MTAVPLATALLLGLSVGFSLAGPVMAADGKAVNTVSVDALESLVTTIEDEGERTAFVKRLKALIAAQKDTAADAKTEFGVGLIGSLSERARQSRDQIVVAFSMLSDMPVLLTWLRAQVTDDGARDAWFGLLVKLLAALAAGIVAEKLAGLMLSRPRVAVEGREADSLLVRVPFVLLRAVLEAVPVAIFAGVAYAVLAGLQPVPVVQVVALTVIYAYAVTRAALIAARLVLVPAVPSLRVLPLGDETANYLFIWTRRLVAIAVIGYLASETALTLGLPQGGYAMLQRFAGLLICLMAVVFILQNRIEVGKWLRGEEDGKLFGLGSLRQRFADIWHVLAIMYVVGVFAVWALDIAGGFAFLLRATMASLAILLAARLITAALRRALERGFAVKDDVKQRFPTLESRANRYMPALHITLRTVVYIIAILAFLQAWNLDVFAWLDSPLGRRLIQSGLSIAAIVVIALLVWEAVNSSIERYLSGTDAAGNPVARSARIRTLLPLARNAVLVVLAVMVTLIVLSELGIDIAPLLAGAGVVGLAIGFGAQTLVKDIITGLFILIEDTIAVGDFIEVSSHSGTVEALSIRTLRLRDPAGSVHTVPFSEVSTVLNYTKEFSYAVLDIGIGYRESVDEVMAVVEDIGAEMMEDADLAANILEPLEVQGVNSLDDSAVVIRARIKTKPGMQWGMRRAFNRRMKNRFDELGIEIPFPHTTVYFGEDKQGMAPPARVQAHLSDTPLPTAADTPASDGAASDGAAARPRLRDRNVSGTDESVDVGADPGGDGD